LLLVAQVQITSFASTSDKMKYLEPKYTAISGRYGRPG
jgi:hypothetical protein